MNLKVEGTDARVQAVIAGADDFSTVLARLDDRVSQLWGSWRPPQWPDLSRWQVPPPTGAKITRFKMVTPVCCTPLQAVRAMDAMDYDVHLFNDKETGEDAIVYRAGPSGMRLSRQRRMYPPAWLRWPSGVPDDKPRIVVNSFRTPTISVSDALDRVCSHQLRFLFFTDTTSGRGHLLHPRCDGNLSLVVPKGIRHNDD
ncbi:sigma 54 modulation/S30EA ribosomal C-terminal domain-containing protein [Mycolicibacterium stellerae]|uniref:sigma 54 modulation/S30EA ribosomal C-terminal domain-containing protein n=1 Tax=Mycolicibacterium stellerae TaxID=2358193 RepID=UPI001F1B4008|nr:sigma 54 modulation/S30EA ribosomal C-terminal domain-containing protein [Mycolicibacterium stellerae]